MNIKIIRLFLATAVIFLTAVARAIPAWPGAHTMTQPDGTTLTYYLMGDEHYHSFVTTDGYLIALDSDGAMKYTEAIRDDGTLSLSQQLVHNESTRMPQELSYLKEKGLRDFNKIYQRVISLTTHNSPSTSHNSQLTPRKSRYEGNFPTTGEVKGLVIMVEFKDNEFQPEYTRELYERQLNEESYADYDATGSARDYFISQSMGQFTPKFDVVGPVKLPRVMAYYGAETQMQNDMHPDDMVVDACQIAHDSLGVNFSQYDYNDDGAVDFVFIIYAGFGQNYGASSNTIWPHMSTLQAQNVYFSLDGKDISRYACSCELNGKTGTELDGIGALCHEFGHVLGLPDMYNTYNSSRTQLGSWDVMDGGSYNNNSRTPPSYTAFERYSLGWMELTELDEPADSLTLPEISQNNVGYRISTADENEFFTLENHQQVGWDAYQAGRGLMIIHVIYDQSVWDANGVNAGLAPRYDLMEADGTQGYDQATDLYPIEGNDMFTDYSSPNSLSWAGIPTEKGVTRIRDNDGIISFRFMKDRLHRPLFDEPTDITDRSFQLNWQPVDDAIGYNVSIREILPDELNPILFDEDFSLMTESDYPKSGMTDLGNDNESYFHQWGWLGSDIYASNGYVRIGSYGKDGTLTTPVIERPADVETLTLHFKGVSYPGKKVSYTVELVDAMSGETVQTESLKADKNETDVRIVFEQTPQHSRIRFATSKERLFLNQVRLLKGDVDSAAVWSAGPKAWEEDSIEGNSWIVRGLEPERTYICSVLALATGGLTSSLPSEEIAVTTLEDSGIPTGLSELTTSRKVVSVSYFDLFGRPVPASAKGVIICKVAYDDGSSAYMKTAK